MNDLLFIKDYDQALYTKMVKAVKDCEKVAPPKLKVIISPISSEPHVNQEVTTIELCPTDVDLFFQLQSALSSDYTVVAEAVN